MKEKIKEFIDSGETFTIVTRLGSYIQWDRSYSLDGNLIRLSDWNVFPVSEVTHVAKGRVLNISRPKRQIGSDPEFFFAKDGKAVPSSDILPEQPIDTIRGKIIRDGFQGELNPRSETCRELAARRVGYLLRQANKCAESFGAELTFDSSIVIPDDVWERLPDTSKVFGCNPTINAYDEEQEIPDGRTVRFRSAGGHIHLALDSAEKKSHKKLIKLLDIIVGNSCVMIDRDINQVERRKIYGRAGEYRIKPYGVEYRVPSNFWIKNYVLTSMVFGLSRTALGILNSGKANEFLALFDTDKVRQAINENNQQLALENLDILIKYFKDNNIVSDVGLSIERLDKFRNWVTSNKPLRFFRARTNQGILRHWGRYLNGHINIGFEKFISKLK